MSTPKKGTPIKNAPPSATDSPGTWRHPRLNEITRRREATTFSEKNVRRILYNIAWLFGLWTVQLLAKIYFSPQTQVPFSFHRQGSSRPLFLFPFLFANLAAASLPPRDSISAGPGPSSSSSPSGRSSPPARPSSAPATTWPTFPSPPPSASSSASAPRLPPPPRRPSTRT